VICCYKMTYTRSVKAQSARLKGKEEPTIRDMAGDTEEDERIGSQKPAGEEVIEVRHAC